MCGRVTFTASEMLAQCLILSLPFPRWSAFYAKDSEHAFGWALGYWWTSQNQGFLKTLSVGCSLPLESLYSVRLELNFLLKQQFQKVIFEDPVQFQVQVIKLEIKCVLGSFDTGKSLRAASPTWVFLLPFINLCGRQYPVVTWLISGLCLVDGIGWSCGAGERTSLP